MDMFGGNTLDNARLMENLKIQLSELEMLQSMFCNPGELRIDDVTALNDIQDFTNGITTIIPPFLDITINLIIENSKFEFCINLSHEYPLVEPDIFIRSQNMKKEGHAKLNKGLLDFINELERGEPCIFSAITWVQDNANKYIHIENEETQKIEISDDLVRLWIYSHHIYSKTKRREILNLANQLKITGFCMPGKPGVICVEGLATDCCEWWQAIKAMNWKRIFCKINEECKDGDRDTFLKFKNFEEMTFQNNNIKCNHMDMGELHKFLEKHSLDKQPQEVDPIKNERMGNVREVGSQAIWSLSSCKPGFGVEQLRDDRTDTYWQSDGQLPHLVNIQFQRKTTVSDIFIYTEYKLDESYTPSRISIRIGTHFNDLQEIEVIMLTEPAGWVHIPIKDIYDKPIRMFMIQIAVTSNHQNGRDTHMRQIKIHSPTEGRGIAMDNFMNFSTIEFQRHATIR
ncbi:hypothetical protein FQA39_LY12571 [Lamprigera yunnana]|nr:hypothetical protein FQA39_LY12571 [Lamprigera yunnana]